MEHSDGIRRSWAAPTYLGLVVLLYSPALLSFGTHVVEHVWPLGFSRGWPDQVWRLPLWWALTLSWFSEHCVTPTWCGIGLGLWASMRQPFRWPVRSGLAALSILAFVSMRGMNDVNHSCFGEAPHAFWLSMNYGPPRPLGSVSGLVLDESATPIRLARIELSPLEAKEQVGAGERPVEWTTDRGEYLFRDVNPGRYLVSIHRFSAPTAALPSVGVYYPGVREEGAAHQIAVTAFNTTTLSPVRLHRLETGSIVVNVMFEDGVRPLSSNLLFHNPQFPAQAVIGDVAPEIENGRGPTARNLSLPRAAADACR